MTIKGQNLGCVTSIFGSKIAADATNAEALLKLWLDGYGHGDCALAATGPVQVTLHTVESDATGAPPTTASFTYTRPPLQTLKVHGGKRRPERSRTRREAFTVRRRARTSSGSERRSR